MCESGCECALGNVACECVSLSKKLLSLNCVCMRVWLLSLMTAASDSICRTVTQETMSMTKTAAVVREGMSVSEHVVVVVELDP